MNSDLISGAIIMAAGLGTRLRPFTEQMPKALLPVMNIPITQYHLDSFRTFGVETVAINVHHHAQLATAELGKLDHPGLDLKISHEDTLLLGSGGGLRQSAELLNGERVFFANSDVLSDINWEELWFWHLRLRKKWGVQITLTVFPSPASGGDYSEIIFDPKTYLIQGVGKPRPGSPFFVGAGVVEKEALATLPLGQVSEMVPRLLLPAIQNRQAGVFMKSGFCMDVGSPKSWYEAHLNLLQTLETGQNLNSRSMQTWQKRILAENLRLGERQWIAQGSCRPKRLFASSYVNVPAKSVLPEEIGPGAVLYGDPGQLDCGLARPLNHGIGYHGKWVGLNPESILDSSVGK